MLNLLLDAAGNIAHAYIFLFVILLIVPFIKAGIEICRIIQNYEKQNKENNIKIKYLSSSHPNDEMNLLLSSKAKLEEGYGLNSLSWEEKRVLKKYEILK